MLPKSCESQLLPLTSAPALCCGDADLAPLCCRNSLVRGGGHPLTVVLRAHGELQHSPVVLSPTCAWEWLHCSCPHLQEGSGWILSNQTEHISHLTSHLQWDGVWRDHRKAAAEHLLPRLLPWQCSSTGLPSSEISSSALLLS